MMSPLIGELDAFRGSVSRGKAVNVNDRGIKGRAINLARRYFSEFRPQVVQQLGESSTGEIDAEWQALVRLAHGNNARRSYLARLGTLRRRLSEVNVTLLSTASGNAVRTDPLAPSAEERLLIETIEGLVPSAAASYMQGLRDLRGPDRPSYRGTAVEFREALREILDHLAPDDAVMAQAGFKLEERQTRPTMKQKVRFVLRSRGLGKSHREASERSVDLVEELMGDITRAVYTRAAVSTHVLQSKDEVRRVKRFVDTVLFDLLEVREPESGPATMTAQLRERPRPKALANTAEGRRVAGREGTTLPE